MTTTPNANASNTSAVAHIDGDPLATIHASPMADVLASYNRSVALVVDRADLYALLRHIDPNPLADPNRHDKEAAARIAAAIEQTLDLGLR